MLSGQLQSFLQGHFRETSGFWPMRQVGATGRVATISLPIPSSYSLLSVYAGACVMQTNQLSG